MPEQREEWITKRAYELWEQAGRPDGHDHEHWAEATAEWERLQVPSAPAESSPGAWEEEEERYSFIPPANRVAGPALYDGFVVALSQISE